MPKTNIVLMGLVMGLVSVALGCSSSASANELSGMWANAEEEAALRIEHEEDDLYMIKVYSTGAPEGNLISGTRKGNVLIVEEALYDGIIKYYPAENELQVGSIKMFPVPSDKQEMARDMAASSVYISAMENDLRNLAVDQEIYFEDNDEYRPTLGNVPTSDDVTLRYAREKAPTSKGYVVEATHSKTSIVCQLNRSNNNFESSLDFSIRTDSSTLGLGHLDCGM